MASKKKSAKSLLSSALNVYNYRRDVISLEDANLLKKLIHETEEAFDNSKTAEYEKLAAVLEKHMLKCGGKIYPWGFWTDNVDVVLVAGILALSLRSFFFTSMQIPTNSMYPTYHGMQPHVYSAHEESPNLFGKIKNFVLLGASNYVFKSPENGEVFVELNDIEGGGRYNGLFADEVRPSKWLGVLPSREKVLRFYQNNKAYEFTFPADFSIETVMQKAYPFGVRDNDFSSYYMAMKNSGRILRRSGKVFLNLGSFQMNQNVLNFDILCGDTLLVDKFTYNFRSPKVGESFVFRTGKIEGMRRYNNGELDDKYYIKRLVGLGGDTLKIDGTTLIRNGEPIKGSAAFNMNAQQEGDYCGYKAFGALESGKLIKVSDKHYYAMGDNSENSLDSRFWGDVPEREVVGKPLLVFYPFSERWGSAK